MTAHDGNEPSTTDDEKPPIFLDDYEYPRLSDVILHPEAQEQLTDFYRNIAYSGVYLQSGVKPEKIVLFNGPPGTGKTFAAKAVRNELAALGRDVYWKAIDVGNTGSIYVNGSALRLRASFDEIKKIAPHFDHLIEFYDECDDLLGSRNGSDHQHYAQATNELLKQFQEIQDYSQKISVILSTNFGNKLDAAAVRSGRVDKIIEFQLPTLEGRLRAFKQYLSQVREKSSYDVIGNASPEVFAGYSRGYSYADIASVVEEAVRESVHRTLANDNKTGKIVALPTVSVRDWEVVFARHDKRIQAKKNRIGYGSQGSHGE